MPVAGLRGTGQWATDERPKNFREFILWRNPNGDTPITGLMSKIGKESTDDPEFAWWDEPLTMVRLQVNGALVAGDTTIVVDSADPDASSPDILFGDARNLVPGDLLRVEPTNDVATWTEEVVMVTAVQSATNFTVSRGAAGTTAASIGDDAFLTRVGSAYAEGTPSPSSATRNPYKTFNYTQIFKTSYELTGTAEKTNLRTGDPLANDKKRKMHDHSVSLEHAWLYGVRSETTGANGQPLRTTNGLRAQIASANTTVFAATPTVSTFLDAVYPVFDYDTQAGDTRIAFCGNKALNALNKMIQTDSQTEMDLGDRITIFGMNLREYILPQGRLLLRTHPLLNRHPKYNDSIFILDFSAMRYRYMRGRDTKAMDNIQANDEDTRKGQWMTEAGLELRYSGLTCGYLGRMSIVA